MNEVLILTTVKQQKNWGGVPEYCVTSNPESTHNVNNSIQNSRVGTDGTLLSDASFTALLRVGYHQEQCFVDALSSFSVAMS